MIQREPPEFTILNENVKNSNDNSLKDWAELGSYSRTHTCSLLLPSNLQAEKDQTKAKCMESWLGGWSEIPSLWGARSSKIAGWREFFYAVFPLSACLKWKRLLESNFPEYLRASAKSFVTCQYKEEEDWALQRLHDRAGSTLLLCHPETSWYRSSPWIHPNQYQFQGNCAQELTPALWSLHV